MIEITFREFYEYKYEEDGFHELYVMKNGLGEILYIGISNQNIWNRWFGMRGHILDNGKFMSGESLVGKNVVNHLPGSWSWKIQLWTLNDCIEFCKKDLSPNGKYTIKYLEPLMIKRLKPALNTLYNLTPGADSMPKSEKEKHYEKLLDKAYRDVFEKKK
jgi:hypothetical protein